MMENVHSEKKKIKPKKMIYQIIGLIWTTLTQQENTHTKNYTQAP